MKLRRSAPRERKQPLSDPVYQRLVDKWRKDYADALAYDRIHGLRDTTVELGGKARAADELEQALASPPPDDPPHWRPIATAPVNEDMLIGGGGCPYVHQNRLRDFRTAGRAWEGLGDKQQPTHWMPLPAPPDEPEAHPREDDGRDILTTECCGVVLETESRFCPKCGWECRIRRTSSVAPPDDPPHERSKCVHCGGPNAIVCNRCHGMVAYGHPFRRPLASAPPETAPRSLSMTDDDDVARFGERAEGPAPQHAATDCAFCGTDKPIRSCPACTQRWMTAMNLVPRDMVPAPTKKELRDVDG